MNTASLCDRCDRVTARFSAVLFVGGGAALVGVLGLTLAGIILRACDRPLRGVVEISGYLGAAAIGLCLPRTQRAAGHIEGGMFHERLPRQTRRWQRGGATLAGMAFMGLLAVEMTGLGLFVREGMERIDGWDFSYDAMVFALALGCAGQALEMFNELVQHAARRHNPVEVNHV